MPDINGIPYVESSDLVSGWPTVSQSVAQEVSDQLASKLPYSYGTATPSTTDSGFLWYDSNSTPAAPKFWDGAAFQALTSGKILQIVRATDSTNRSTNSTSMVDANISVTITPQKSDSAVLLIWTLYASPLSTGSRPLQQQEITDNSNNRIAGTGALTGINTVTSETAYHSVTAFGWSTPATTSATTYKGRFRALDAATAAQIVNGAQTGQLFALEVSA